MNTTAIKSIKEILLSFKQTLLYQRKRNEFYRDLSDFMTLSKHKLRGLDIDMKNLYPCLNDKKDTTEFDRHYIYHTAWASRIINELNPDVHYDISSSLYFCSIVSAFNKVKFYDFRPANLQLNNLTTESANILHLPFEDNSINSLSCMHVVEHIGLGRYGDALDPDGDLKAISELKRVLGNGGSLLFVVPIGKPRIIFNAHRIYSYTQILDYFSDLYLNQFALIPDSTKDGELVYDAPIDLINSQKYGCGCFWFQKG
jgi:SAM-dependent methyltransferase